MIASHVQNGCAIDYTPAAAVAAGDVIVQGELVGVAPRPIATGELGALAVEGVFAFPKAVGAGSAITAGANTYWDSAAKLATTNAAAGANKLIGKTILAAADADSDVRVRLLQ